MQILREVPAGPDVTLASVTMSHSGRMLFAGTATGLLRAVKFPLTVPGEWNEYVAHATAITKVCSFSFSSSCTYSNIFSYSY